MVPSQGTTSYHRQHSTKNSHQEELRSGFGHDQNTTHHSCLVVLEAQRVISAPLAGIWLQQLGEDILQAV